MFAASSDSEETRLSLDWVVVSSGSNFRARNFYGCCFLFTQDGKARERLLQSFQSVEGYLVTVDSVCIKHAAYGHGLGVLALPCFTDDRLRKKTTSSGLPPQHLLLSLNYMGSPVPKEPSFERNNKWDSMIFFVCVFLGRVYKTGV